MVCPQRSLDDTRGHGRHTDPVEFIQFGHGAHEAADSVLGGRIHRSCERCILPGNTGDVEDVLGLFVIAEAEEVRDGELGGADGVSDIDVDQAVTASGKSILARRCAGRTPEVTPMLLWSALDFLVVRGSFIEHRTHTGS